MKDRFDLENELMGCWHVVDDLDVLISHLDDPFFLGMKGDHADRLANALIGMKTLYDIKFNVMMDTFADCIQELEPPAKRPSPLDTSFDWTRQSADQIDLGLNDIPPEGWDNPSAWDKATRG